MISCAKSHDPSLFNTYLNELVPIVHDDDDDDDDDDDEEEEEEKREAD